jgi:cupin fold WbuC family metalloprotein
MERTLWSSLKNPSEPVIRVSPAATRSTHDSVCPITASLVAQKAADALRNERHREIHMFHADERDPVQRMLNALQPSTYGRPHRHGIPPKSETILLLRGCLGFVSFSPGGTAQESDFVLLGPQSGTVGLDCRAGVWHTFFALEPDTVVFEVKQGPFDAATDKDPAPWAPAENTIDGSHYLAGLEDRFRLHFGLDRRTWVCPCGHTHQDR